MKNALKAYEVREDGEGNCCITFATNSATARREGANELNTEWESIESCKRAPWADQYAPGPVPLSGTLDAGWWHECCHCGTQFDSDGRRDSEHKDRDDEFEPVEDSGHNFCSPTCKMGHWAEQRDRKARENATVEACVAFWPSATSITAHQTYVGRGSETKAMACFRFPGGKFGVQWIVGDSQVSVSLVDKDAFEEWNKSKR